MQYSGCLIYSPLRGRHDVALTCCWQSYFGVYLLQERRLSWVGVYDPEHKLTSAIHSPHLEKVLQNDIICSSVMHDCSKVCLSKEAQLECTWVENHSLQITLFE